MAMPVAGRELGHAQRIALRVEPHRLRVDCDRPAEIEPGRQIALVIVQIHIAQGDARLLNVWLGPAALVPDPPLPKQAKRPSQPLQLLTTRNTIPPRIANPMSVEKSPALRS